jgi:hypothetical protein
VKVERVKTVIDEALPAVILAFAEVLRESTQNALDEVNFVWS